MRGEGKPVLETRLGLPLPLREGESKLTFHP